MKSQRDVTVLVFHSSVRSSWNETLAGIYRFARPQGWNVQAIEHEPDHTSIAELMDFWRPSGVIVEGGMDEKGVFLSDVLGTVPVVYLACDSSRLPAGALRVNHDSSSLGRVAAREFLSLLPPTDSSALRTSSGVTSANGPLPSLWRTRRAKPSSRRTEGVGLREWRKAHLLVSDDVSSD